MKKKKLIFNKILIKHKQQKTNSESIQQFDANGMQIDEFIAHIKQEKFSGLVDEYKDIRAQPILSSYNEFK
jgi:hypothetical protein